MIMIGLRSSALIAFLLGCSKISAFTTPSRSSFVAPSSTTKLHIGAFFRQNDGGSLDTLVEGGAVTPEGFGFSTPASRIISAAGSSSRYYRAGPNDPVSNVIAAISSSTGNSIALIFDSSGDMLGAFTETNFIKVSIRCDKRRRFIISFLLFLTHLRHCSSLLSVLHNQIQKKTPPTFSLLLYPTMSLQHQI
mmetsp:Transcript_17806/g.25675  ORF Transcript_17806/g.25675 Transcript_17806/m.25675 type:complete len:192 (-) Transcript_17806:1820-2395(-)